MAIEPPSLAKPPTREQLRARREYRRALRRARNPLHFSLRSLTLALTLALLAALAIAGLALSLRSESSPPAAEPIIDISPLPAASFAAPPTERAAEGEQIILAAQTPANLALTGPPVPTVILTDTPLPLAVGLLAEVVNVGVEELNVRNLPNRSSSKVLFRAAAGAQLQLIGGPLEAEGFIWWRVRDAQFAVEGWAAGRYLQAISTQNGG
ncbi:MAG: hypothetical protein OXG92_13690 [Chloroflexi bacterium]|nr:hypothetical protein [Chloroflexota bacterium]MCY3582344.1 hypothetical protein [Chloroflexota bacterium]MCY3717504.1 hypothetical protein [Chloroflexota bacterium]MDE2652010.1 hypothetical protein [Chloroflexota bacterium]